MTETTTRQDTSADRLKRMPAVLRAYAKDAAKGIIPDSGLAEVLTFTADTLERQDKNNGNTAQLCWTTDKPRAQGYYWLRMSGDALGVEIARVKADPYTKQLFVHEHGDKRHYKLHSYADGCEWYGPISEPIGEDGR